MSNSFVSAPEMTFKPVDDWNAVCTVPEPDATYHKGHNIYEKDFYRLLKAETHNDKHFKKQANKTPGRCDPPSLSQLKNSKFKTAQSVILEQLERG